MSSISNSKNEGINNFINFINGVINHRLDIGTMTEEDAKILRNMLIRIRNDTELFNAIKSFNKSLLYLDINWTTGVSSTYDDNTTTSVKFANILASLLV